MDKIYNPALIEESIYHMWETGGYFAPPKKPRKKPFTIIMPPPNANDPLHIGHAMFITAEDILIRFHRMLGDDTLWLPGADHAGIETQFVFEKKLKKDGKSRFDVDRQTLFDLIWHYVEENKTVAVNQMKKLGASADWNRFTFTLDKSVVDINLATFTKLHNDGLLYRDVRLVNYCTRCGTGFSELEVKHEVKKDPLLYIRYGDFVIATVRPETKFRDSALAVHPKDKRYKQHIGKTYDIPGLLGPIRMTVLPDPDVDPNFGTGIMKVTPAHDVHDFELGKKHGLAVTPIIGTDGKMDFSWYLHDKNFPSQPTKYQDRARLYHGLHVTKARPLMTEHLRQDGLLVSVNENYEHTVATCYRCGSTLEPLPLPQFYIKVQPLVAPVLKAIKEKNVKIHGAGHDKILAHWLKNLKDWNISRQIVWGIRIPVWYSLKDNPTIHVTYRTQDNHRVTQSGGEILRNGKLEEAKNGLQQLRAPLDATFIIGNAPPGPEYLQETDTFDTWFSSGQWPVSTLKSRPGDFDRFYPTQVLETAYDILIFWVMRMLLMGIYMTGKPPFTNVYLHGLVRDEKGQKMSKSKGNVVNPLEIVSRYGADSLRMALVMGTTPGQDSAVGEGKIRGMRNFANKIWNAGRFVAMKVAEQKSDTQGNDDAQFQKKLASVVQKVTSELSSLHIGQAAETVHNQFWHWYCDDVIEKSKTGKISTKALLEGLRVFLILLHPFMPFITEHLWEKFKTPDQSPLIVTKWPQED